MWIILVRINLANDRSWINLESWEWIFYRFTPGRSLFMMMSLHLNFNLSKSLLFLIPFLVSTWLSSVSDCMKEVAWMEVQFGTTGYQQGNSRVSSHKLIHFPLEENACVDHSGNEEGRCVACSWFLQLDHHFAEVGLCFLSSLSVLVLVYHVRFGVFLLKQKRGCPFILVPAGCNDTIYHLF
jgi:hypothetical protein